MKEYITLFLKGTAIGAANIIPGVSGGTIALITGIFEKLIYSIKSFDIKAIKLLFIGKFEGFSNYVNLNFLITVLLGIIVSILTLAKILAFLFDRYPVFIWAYFFGLIFASVYFVGKTISKYNTSVILIFIFGTVIAAFISILNPATENRELYYLFICGIVAVCSMILPGLSGSFVLILMGNYELVFIYSVNNLDVKILLPVILGAIFGLLAFSHLLSWIFLRFKNETIALLTGFILGSLSILWPWKNEVYLTDEVGNLIFKNNGDLIIQGYNKYFPESFNREVVIAIFLIILGVVTIWLIEKFARRKEGNPDEFYEVKQQ
jgi:putative membrane protein